MVAVATDQATIPADVSDLSLAAQLVWQHLRRLRGFKDRFGRSLRKIGQGWLAGRIGRTKRTIRRALAELEQAGFIKRLGHPRRFIDGRWYSIDVQTYAILAAPVENRITAGQTERTFSSGPPLTGGEGGRPGAPGRAPNHAHSHTGGPCGHGDPGGSHRCALCRRGVPGYED